MSDVQPEVVTRSLLDVIDVPAQSPLADAIASLTSPQDLLVRHVKDVVLAQFYSATESVITSLRIGGGEIVQSLRLRVHFTEPPKHGFDAGRFDMHVRAAQIVDTTGKRCIEPSHCADLDMLLTRDAGLAAAPLVARLASVDGNVDLPTVLDIPLAFGCTLQPRTLFLAQFLCADDNPMRLRLEMVEQSARPHIVDRYEIVADVARLSTVLVTAARRACSGDSAPFVLPLTVWRRHDNRTVDQANTVEFSVGQIRGPADHLRVLVWTGDTRGRTRWLERAASIRRLRLVAGGADVQWNAAACAAAVPWHDNVDFYASSMRLDLPHCFTFDGTEALQVDFDAPLDEAVQITIFQPLAASLVYRDGACDMHLAPPLAVPLWRDNLAVHGRYFPLAFRRRCLMLLCIAARASTQLWRLPLELLHETICCLAPQPGEFMDQRDCCP